MVFLGPGAGRLALVGTNFIDDIPFGDIMWQRLPAEL